MKLIILLSLFLINSCIGEKTKMSTAELDLKLSEEWIYTEKLLNFKVNGVELTRPPGVEQLVMGLLIPQKGGLSRIIQCVYYVVPYKEKVSILKIQEHKDLDICPDTSEKGVTLISVEGINHLNITFKNFKLTMDFQYQKTSKKIEIPMPNVEEGLVHEKYHSIKETRLMSGLKLLKLSDESFDFASNRYLGKLSDRFSLGSAIRCHQVNKDCETVGENRCEDCKYGWFEVVDFQCSQGGSKFCGQNHCGEKNEPACPRGVKVVDVEDAGICQSDLEPTLNLEKILVCQ